MARHPTSFAGFAAARRHVRLVGVACMAINAIMGGAVVQAENTPTGGPAHASLRAYPEAILSVADAASGLTVAVADNGVVLTATDASGKEVWRVDVIAAIGKPSTGAPVVRHVSIDKPGLVSLVLGKHKYADADLRTGAITDLGED
jgi:hypothetical protein